MISKILEKETAIALRRQGKTYSEILKVVPVAKSTISLWFKEVGLSIPEKQRITASRLAAGKRGGIAKHLQRLKRSELLTTAAKGEIGPISHRELFLLGVALYWAEGGKEKDSRPGTQMAFSNMDPRMIMVFLKFLQDIMLVESDSIYFEIYLHGTHAYRVDDVRKYWSSQTGRDLDRFRTVYFKNTALKTTNRKNITEDTYFGVLRIKVRQSSACVRKLAGWADGIYDAIR